VRFPRFVLGVLAIIGAMAMVSAQGAKLLTEGNASISGKVIDGRTGNPIAGVLVWASLSSYVRQPPAGLTDADGAFVLQRVPAGKATVLAKKSGYALGTSAALTLTDNTRMTDAVIRLRQYGRVSGRVTDESGRPVAQVAIESYLRTPLDQLAFDQFSLPSFSNDLGEYELEALPGQYAIGVPIRTSTFPTSGAISHFFSHNDVFLTEPPTALNVISSADRQWWHRVENAPVPPLETPPGHLLTYTTTYFPGATSLSTASLVTVEPGAERTGVDIRLRQSRGYRVSGKVSIPLRPGSGAEATLIGDPVAERSGLSFVTATGRVDGAFMFLGVPPGNYTLAVRRVITTENLLADDTVPMTVRLPVTVGNQDLTGLSITLQRAPEAQQNPRVGGG